MFSYKLERIKGEFDRSRDGVGGGAGGVVGDGFGSSEFESNA
jgi:hypothetical protein